MTVLIVDDSAEIRERLVAMLDGIPGVERIGQATTVAEAVTALSQFKPDLVILDMRLPDGSGLDVLKTIRRDQIPTIVFVLTNFAYPQYERRARAAGAREFLNKAKEFGRLAGLIRALESAQSRGTSLDSRASGRREADHAD
jgi:two-component system response regulator DevR